MERESQPGRPRFSVVMAAYNMEPYLDETVATVVAQTCPDWELVVVDDGSTDRTPDLLAAWSQRDSRIRVVAQERKGKPAFGRNRGIREARGEIITFLDGDDLYHPEKLERQLAILEQWPDVGAAFHDFFWFHSGSEMPANGYLRHLQYLQRADGFFEPASLHGETIYLGGPDFFKFMASELVGIHTSTIAVRRTVLDQIGPDPFNEALPHGEDIHLWLRIGLATRLAYLDRPLSYYRYHNESWVMSIARGKMARGLYEVNGEMLDRLEGLLRPEERSRFAEKVANYWYRIGRRCLEGGLWPEARRSFVKALVRTRRPSQAYLSFKGVVTTVLPKWFLQAYWRRTQGGQFSPRPRPPEAAE